MKVAVVKNNHTRWRVMDCGFTIMLGITRHSLALSWLGIGVIYIAFLGGCVTHQVSDGRPTDSTFLLADCCGAFHDKYQRWPKDFAELSAFIQQSSGKWKLGHYEQVEFAHFPNGLLLGIYDVSDGITNSGTLSPPRPKNKQ